MGSVLLVLSILLLATVVAVLVGITRLRDNLTGRRGHALATVVLVLAYVLALSQALIVAAVLLSAIDHDQTQTARGIIYLAIEGVQVGAMLWALWRLDRLDRNERATTMNRTDQTAPPQEGQDQ